MAPPVSGGTRKSKSPLTGASASPMSMPFSWMRTREPSKRPVTVTVVLPAHSGPLTPAGGTGVLSCTTTGMASALTRLHLGSSWRALMVSPSASGGFTQKNSESRSKQDTRFGPPLRRRVTIAPWTTFDTVTVRWHSRSGDSTTGVGSFLSFSTRMSTGGAVVTTPGEPQASC
jgi:hypothetical protein